MSTSTRPWIRSLIPIASVIAFGLLSRTFTAVSSDLGWILTFGHDTVVAGKLPATNGYSFLEPNHPVVMHEWLACVLLYLAHAWGGTAALSAVKYFTVAFVLAAVGAAIRSVTPSVAVLWITLFLAMDYLPSAFTYVRPQLFSWCFFAFLTYAGLSGRRWTLWACVPMFVLWANMHGAVLAGALLLTALCAGAAIERRLTAATQTPHMWELIIVPAAAALALLANPYGAGLLIHTFHHATDEVRLLNQEWMPLWHAGPLHPFEREALCMYVAVAALAIVALPWRRVRLWVLVVFAISAGLSAGRHTRMSPILLAPAVASSIDALLIRFAPRLREILERWVPWVATAALLAFGATWAVGVRDAGRLMDTNEMNPGTALWIMRSNSLTGKVWNDFNWGGTLMWAVPEDKLACDGRNVAAYSASTLESCMVFGVNGRDPLNTVEKSGADLVLLPSHHPALATLEEKYLPLYCDDSACLLSNRPGLVARRASLRLPPGPVNVSDFFTSPGRPFLSQLPMSQ